MLPSIRKLTGRIQLRIFSSSMDRKPDSFGLRWFMIFQMTANENFSVEENLGRQW
jgi:hypothetical protein